MLGDLIKILREYSMKNLVHGDIQPGNIFIVEDNGKKDLVIIDSAFLTDFETGYFRALNDPDYKTPLSNRALTCLMERDINARYDRTKNDIWSAAITM